MLNFFRSNTTVKSEMERLRGRSKYFLPMLSVTLFGLAASLVFVPKFSELTGLKLVLDQEHATKKSLEQKNSDLSSIDLLGKKNDLASLTYLLPDEEDLTSLILGVTRLSQGEGLAVTDLKLDLKAKSNFSVKFGFDVKGSYPAIQNLVLKLPQIKRMYIPDKFELRYLGSDQGYVASVSLSAPFAPLPKDLGEATSAIRDYTEEEKKLVDTIATFPVYIDTLVQDETTTPATKINPFE
ncbi:MAG: hypothetical protein A3F33_03995 [Candidatus Woykebacteria bacterium RIFCSPHIGHO2_12_FULL_43_10]|uniref:Uncharacterized protein n=2 Tax=Candidatus Woykeibacteriota TaxID=1817899 RepID=A0A1G1WWP4_9BACT|nr:MAG: hypothetical protein A3J50_03970 [Candidatus Woykebacteria bacterium RIFCSPHIGHO2_02_FULL_43_16b]OGY29053.1 MAG: hypothetical protein A3F33_03995 [Candidatus Woykebacteria bacterium RIFCSPHIGHO2_12_FULL_43_10]OGY32178.1 MAG: hypothetical protein A3A61_01525 [Candidatus Woykebacteria bacterium RIFCSPLOWO2_01_FULL_43_14]